MWSSGAGGVPAGLLARGYQPELDEDRDSLALEGLLVDLAGLATLAQLAVLHHEGLFVDRRRLRLGRAPVLTSLALERGALLTLQLTRTLLEALSSSGHLVLPHLGVAVRAGGGGEAAPKPPCTDAERPSPGSSEVRRIGRDRGAGVR